MTSDQTLPTGMSLCSVPRGELCDLLVRSHCFGSIVQIYSLNLVSHVTYFIMKERKKKKPHAFLLFFSDIT